MTFSSHVYEIESKYYQTRVSSFLEKDNHQIGAVVEYTPCFVEEKDLPQNETIIGSLAGLDDHLFLMPLVQKSIFFSQSLDGNVP